MAPRAAPAVAAAEGSGAATKTDVRGLKARARAGDDAYAGAYRQGQTHARAGRAAEPPFDADLAAAYQQGHDDASAEREAKTTGRARQPSGPAAGPAGTERSRGPAGPTSRAGAGAGSSLGGRLLGGGGPLDSGAGLLLGAILYANVVNYLRGGLPAVRGWWAAKFLNKPYRGPLAASKYSGAASNAATITTVSHQRAVGPAVGVPPVLSGAGAATSTGSVLA